MRLPGFMQLAYTCADIFTVCRICGHAPERISAYDDFVSRRKVIVFRCHGESEESSINFWEPGNGTGPLGRVEAADLMLDWPRLIFDRYTMIPLSASLGFAEENEDICAAVTAGLDWPNAHQMDPDQA